jgi:hypothetical protein
MATVSDARVRRHEVRDAHLHLAHGGLGKTQFAVQTQYLLGQGQWSSWSVPGPQALSSMTWRSGTWSWPPKRSSTTIERSV